MEISVWINLIYRVLIRNHALQYWRVPGWQAKTGNLFGLYWFVKLKWDWISLKKLLLDRYLDIYISRKIGLCMRWFGRSKLSIFWSENSNLLHILIFLLFFAGVVKSSAFCTPLLLFQRVEVFTLQFDAKTWIKYFNLFETTLTVSKTGFDKSCKQIK